MKPLNFGFLLSIVSAALLTASSCQKPGLLPQYRDSLPSQPPPPDSMPKTKPNIILILGDDIGYEVPGYTGGQSWPTPNIDQMAAQGLRFSRCFGSPMCSPSRFMLLTGKYNFRNYYATSWGDLGLNQRTIANMLQANGYTTCVAGKWQFNHGDTGIKTFGFDKYCITNPFKVLSEDNSATLQLYKNPTIYENGKYLPDSAVLGKYSEDFFLNYIFNFMDSTSKINKPFFIYWAPNLCHQPFSPTPDDPDFATWDPQKKPQDGDTIYFKSMVNYYDKDIGKLLTKLKESNLEKNTLILFLIGDNGTEDIIKSKFEDHYVVGGKGHTYLTGIHISLIAYWAGKILPARDGNIVDFVDFLPTIADVAKINLPTTYGTLDGISFYDQLLGYAINKRQYSYEWYDVNRFGPDNIPPTSWALDKDYKVYNGDSDLINYTTDPFEKNPITYSNQTSDQKSEHAILENVIKSYH